MLSVLAMTVRGQQAPGRRQLASRSRRAAAERTYPAIVKSGEVYVRWCGGNGWFGAVSVKVRLRRMIRQQKERCLALTRR